MKKAAIYTKGGDKGETGLVGGTRVFKNDERIHLYGQVDELNSQIGLALAFIADKRFHGVTQNIQSRLFDIGSNMACESSKRDEFKIPQINEEHILQLEKAIDEINAELPELKNFILPGGSKASSAMHVCRTVCRRVERFVVEFNKNNPDELSMNILKYLNRLSDFLFVYARYLNKVEKIEEVIWKV